MVAQRVATAVRALDDFEAYGPDDRRRLATARDTLAIELEVRAGLTPRVPIIPPDDPAQYVLMTIEREEPL